MRKFDAGRERVFLLAAWRVAASSTWPEWLLTALFAAGLGVVGFVLKELYSRWDKRRETRRQAARTLAEFGRLLAESDVTARQHFEWRDRLYASLRAVGGSPGTRPNEPYNDIFARLHDDFTPEQRKLFGLLRSSTLHSMRPQNQGLLDWATAHSARQLFGSGPEQAAFDAQLQLLREHLRAWHDKYKAGFEDDPRQSLVYLNDEDQHGKPFPKALSPTTQQLLARYPA